jgi:hypothetical protein
MYTPNTRPDDEQTPVRFHRSLQDEGRVRDVVFRIIWRIISELFGVVPNAPLQHEPDSPPDQDDFKIRHLPRRLSISRSSQEAALPSPSPLWTLRIRQIILKHYAT